MPAGSSAACARSRTSRRRASSPRNNRVLDDDIDTVFFMTAIEFGYVSSSLVKEIARVRRRRLDDGPARRGHRAPHAQPARRSARAEVPRACHNRAALDIMFLLERLESQIATGTGVPRTRKVLVDKDAVLDLIDQLRVAVPEEVHAAKRINAEGERIIEKANEESARIAARAQEQAAYLIGERGPDRRRRRPRAGASSTRRSAPRTTCGSARTSTRRRSSRALESEVRKALAGIEKGIGVLDMRRAALRGDDALATTAGDAVDDDERFRDDDDDGDLPRDAVDWPTTVEDAVIRHEEDAGQTVPR